MHHLHVLFNSTVQTLFKPVFNCDQNLDSQVTNEMPDKIV